VDLQRRSKSDSHKAFRQLDPKGELLDDEPEKTMPQRGPTTGPGPSDKTTPDEAVQMDDEWMKTNIQLDSTKLKNYMLRMRVLNWTNEDSISHRWGTTFIY